MHLLNHKKLWLGILVAIGVLLLGRLIFVQKGSLPPPPPNEALSKFPAGKASSSRITHPLPQFGPSEPPPSTDKTEILDQ